MINEALLQKVTRLKWTVMLQTIVDAKLWSYNNQLHAPTEEKEEEVKNEFYEDLEQV